MCDQQSLRSACAYAQSDQSLCLSLEYPMSVKLLTEHHLRFLSLKGGCIGSSESTLVKMPHCWKLRVTAQFSWREQRDGVMCHPIFTIQGFKSSPFHTCERSGIITHCLQRWCHLILPPNSPSNSSSPIWVI